MRKVLVDLERDLAPDKKISDWLLFLTYCTTTNISYTTGPQKTTFTLGTKSVQLLNDTPPLIFSEL